MLEVGNKGVTAHRLIKSVNNEAGLLLLLLLPNLLLLAVANPLTTPLPCPAATTVEQITARYQANLTGQIAVVTGGHSGMGRAITVALAQRGAAAIIADVNITTGERHAARLAALCGGAEAPCRVWRQGRARAAYGICREPRNW